jgi:hypothetical protein
VRGLWHHVVGIYAGGIVTVYLDGVKGADVPHGGVLQDAGHPGGIDRAMIGATRDGVGAIAFNLKGLIDEVAIYDRALSPAEIRGHYRAAIPAETPTVQSEGAMVISWPTSPPGFILHAAPNVEGPYDPVLAIPILEDDMFKLALPVEGIEQGYYQLIRP